MDPIIDTAGLSFFGRIRLAVRRLRNSRGFGVHSPAAFTLMREVVRPDIAYGLYSYHRSDCLVESMRLPPKDSRLLAERMRLLLRLCRHLNPESILIYGGATQTLPYSKLPSLCGKPVSRKGETPGLLVMADTGSDPSVSEDLLKKTLAAGRPAVLAKGAMALAGAASSAMRGGVRVLLPDMAILLPLPDSALSTYYA